MYPSKPFYSVRNLVQTPWDPLPKFRLWVFDHINSFNMEAGIIDTLYQGVWTLKLSDSQLLWINAKYPSNLNMIRIPMPYWNHCQWAKKSYHRVSSSIFIFGPYLKQHQYGHDIAISSCKPTWTDYIKRVMFSYWKRN